MSGTPQLVASRRPVGGGSLAASQRPVGGGEEVWPPVTDRSGEAVWPPVADRSGEAVWPPAKQSVNAFSHGVCGQELIKRVHMEDVMTAVFHLITPLPPPPPPPPDCIAVFRLTGKRCGAQCTWPAVTV